MGGNGKDRHYYQDGDESQKQHANRYIDQFPLSEEGTAIVNAVLKGFKCAEQCLIPEEVKPHLGHAAGYVKEAGDGVSVEKGLYALAAQSRFVKGTMERLEKGRNTFFDLSLKAVGYLILIVVGLGIVEFIKLKLGSG